LKKPPLPRLKWADQTHNRIWQCQGLFF
jgi:hypothetical protein